MRTSGRSIPQQLANIGQRQSRIRRIRESFTKSHLTTVSEDLEDETPDPAAHYNVGVSQKLSVHIPTFIQRNEGDPAIKVSRLSFPMHAFPTKL
jgi:hypothetical protein